ncbi:hypothetical protein AMAG_01453 [Allomyces macrogynus ATCC 38327]|uniref:Uncharacterized protein n=1 Tax=Allomyces macrogynus (strain ATCC 38327) TaxID=578462 RepID=A0A0L0RYV1_ALLM3|nr:hypothetical protein AMAG_01453 [Allomyces macrogynus ATCC 38327]|eukprot:KNE55562.1 hypothetical protein AMAG_01453 [Allomyces macrogynus ATCC 38327]
MVGAAPYLNPSHPARLDTKPQSFCSLRTSCRARPSVPALVPAHIATAMSFLSIALSSAFLLSTPLLVAERSEFTATAQHAHADVVGDDQVQHNDRAVTPPPSQVDRTRPASLPLPSSPVSSPSKKRTDSAVSMSSIVPVIDAISARLLAPPDEGLNADPADEIDGEAETIDRGFEWTTNSPPRPMRVPATIAAAAGAGATRDNEVAPDERDVAWALPKPMIDFAVDQRAAVHRVVAHTHAPVRYEPTLDAAHVGIGLPFGI